MEQQLMEEVIDITPATMHEVLTKITSILAQPTLPSQTLHTMVKSLFYGLWNFDKMINQHNLSTQIADILHKIPKKNAFAFLSALFAYLHSKWNFIDHHRINKFMQLVRYLLKQGLKISHKKTDEVLLATIFHDVSTRSGIAYHTTEIYFETICEIYFSPDQKTPNKGSLPFQKLGIFETLLTREGSLENFRLHVMEKVYEKYKEHILETSDPENAEEVFGKIEQFNKHILELAKLEEKDLHRKNLYALTGFMKSDMMHFDVYLNQKQEKARAELEKKKKIITKGKKKEIKAAKEKRKEKNKNKKRAKQLSVNKFEFTAREADAGPMMV